MSKAALGKPGKRIGGGKRYFLLLLACIFAFSGGNLIAQILHTARHGSARGLQSGLSAARRFLHSPRADACARGLDGSGTAEVLHLKPRVLPKLDIVRKHVAETISRHFDPQAGLDQGEMCWGPGSCREGHWCNEEVMRCSKKCRGPYGHCPGQHLRTKDGVGCLQPSYWLNTRPAFGFDRAKAQPRIVFMSLPRQMNKNPYAITQRNAMHSWARQDQNQPQVVLLGNEDGVANISQELGFLHCDEQMQVSVGGRPLLWDLWRLGEKTALDHGVRGDVIVWINSDIIVPSHFSQLITQVAKQFTNFLLVGERYNIKLQRLVDFSNKTEVHELFNDPAATSQGTQAIDYFVFSRGAWKDTIPKDLSLAWAWDQFLLSQAARLGLHTVDGSRVVKALHQTHWGIQDKDLQSVERYRNLQVVEAHGGWLENGYTECSVFEAIPANNSSFDNATYNGPYDIKQRPFPGWAHIVPTNRRAWSSEENMNSSSSALHH